MAELGANPDSVCLYGLHLEPLSILTGQHFSSLFARDPQEEREGGKEGRKLIGILFIKKEKREMRKRGKKVDFRDFHYKEGEEGTKDVYNTHTPLFPAVRSILFLILLHSALFKMLVTSH